MGGSTLGSTLLEAKWGEKECDEELWEVEQGGDSKVNKVILKNKVVEFEGFQIIEGNH